MLGRSGYLVQEQKHLECLALVTDGACSGASSDVELSGFTHLRDLTWQGLRMGNHLYPLLKASSRHLESLELDMIFWERAVVQDIYSDVFGTFGRWQLSPRLKFPSLQELSLSAISFRQTANEVALAFDLSRLRTLKLKKCASTADLLRAIVNLDQSIKFTQLEVVVDADTGIREDFDLRAPTSFLDACEGLEDLHIVSPAIYHLHQTKSFWRSVLGHVSTLKRLVAHERIIVSGQWDAPIDGDVPWCPQTREFLQDCRLECLGLCNDTDFLVGLISFHREAD